MSTRRLPERWVLAFDASCGQCQQISGVVAEEAQGRLDVLALTHADVRRWREQSLGAGAPWAPTLIRIRGDRVRAWTGTAMGLRLVRRLGVRATMELLRSLEKLRHGGVEQPARSGDGPLLGRAGFLRLGAGLSVAAALILTGRTPAFADTTKDTVSQWLEANKDRLPHRYDDVVAHPMTYRQAIYGALPTTAQGELWLEHLRRYRASHPDLSAKQNQVIDRAIAFVGSAFTSERSEASQVNAFVSSAEGQRLKEDVIDAFGLDEGRALVATLGDVSPAYGQHCNCAWDNMWCAVDCIWMGCGCWSTEQGCGSFWSYSCNAWCSGCG